MRAGATAAVIAGVTAVLAGVASAGQVPVVATAASTATETGWHAGGAIDIPHTTYASTVACVSATTCVGSADEQDPFRTRLFSIVDGKVVQQRVESVDTTYSGAACPDDRHCLVVGDRQGRARIVPWVRGQLGQPVSTSRASALAGVDCPTSTSCVAVGADAGQGAVVQLDRAGRVQAAVDTDEIAEFSGVACWTLRRCLAVGDDLHDKTVAAVITDGQPGPLTVVRKNAQLDNVSCGTKGFCVVAGSTYSGKGLVVVFRHGVLRRVHVVAQFLFGAACAGGTHCLVTGATSPDRDATGLALPVRPGHIGQPIRLRTTVGAGDTSCPAPRVCRVAAGNEPGRLRSAAGSCAQLRRLRRGRAGGSLTPAATSSPRNSSKRCS